MFSNLSDKHPFMKEEHPFMKAVKELDPKLFSIVLDGIEIFRGEFTDDGIKTIFDKSVELNKPHRLMNVFFDDIPTPVYSLNLDKKIKQ